NTCRCTCIDCIIDKFEQSIKETWLFICGSCDLLFLFTSDRFSARPYKTMLFSERGERKMTVIQHAEVLQSSKEAYVYIDVRTKTAAFHTGKEAYEHNHIPGAVYLDVKNDLSGKETFLPDVSLLTTKLGQLGINEQTKIVIYDQGNQRAASRAWYVLHYLGHQHVYILQGGYPAWIAINGPVTTKKPNYEVCIYTPNLQPEVATSIKEVKEKLEKERVTLVDSRARERYEGVKESK